MKKIEALVLKKEQIDILEVLKRFRLQRIDIVNFSGTIKSRFSEALIKMEIYADNKKAKKILAEIIAYAKSKKGPLFIELLNLDESVRITGHDKNMCCFFNRQ